MRQSKVGYLEMITTCECLYHSIYFIDYYFIIFRLNKLSYKINNIIKCWKLWKVLLDLTPKYVNKLPKLTSHKNDNLKSSNYRRLKSNDFVRGIFNWFQFIYVCVDSKLFSVWSNKLSFVYRDKHILNGVSNNDIKLWFAVFCF